MKSFICSKFSEWFAEQVIELLYDDDDNPVDLSTASAKWMVALD